MDGSWTQMNEPSSSGLRVIKVLAWTSFLLALLNAMAIMYCFHLIGEILMIQNRNDETNFTSTNEYRSRLDVGRTLR
jgi:hypothetical protein